MRCRFRAQRVDELGWTYEAYRWRGEHHRGLIKIGGEQAARP